MDSMINQMNDSLRVIINNMKGDIDTLNSTLENIQYQMDKKVDEAKKYKIEVDTCKDIINKLEQDNSNLEISLKELSDKYSKLNLVSIIEAGNREIKSKINDNIKEINKNKEHIAELTNRARTIKDLLVNLKKDKSVKQDKVKDLNETYSYYSKRINEIIDFANDHANNLSDYNFNGSSISYNETNDDLVEKDNSEIENTMIFDEIASIDHNKNFKDEMSFISDQIDDTEEPDNIKNIIKNSLSDLPNEGIDDDETNDLGLSKEFIDNNEDESINENVDSSIDINNSNVVSNGNINDENIEQLNNNSEEVIDNNEDNGVFSNSVVELSNLENTNEIQEVNNKEQINLNPVVELDNSILEKTNDINLNNTVSSASNLGKNLNIPSIDPTEESSELKGEEEFNLDKSRVNKINDLFSEIDDSKNNDNKNISNTLNKIDEAYKDSFGVPINEPVKNTLTDIFGNPIKENDINEVSTNLNIEDLFKENNLDFNNFKDDEKEYLKQIYDENKFKSIFEVLKNNKINLDNIYNAFNIFGEISSSELESLISKLLNIGQSAITIGFILEKLPKVKKYDLDAVIMSYGDYVKNVDITELIMKAKKNYDNGGNN